MTEIVLESAHLNFRWKIQITNSCSTRAHRLKYYGVGLAIRGLAEKVNRRDFGVGNHQIPGAILEYPWRITLLSVAHWQLTPK